MTSLNAVTGDIALHQIQFSMPFMRDDYVQDLRKIYVIGGSLNRARSLFLSPVAVGTS